MHSSLGWAALASFLRLSLAQNEYTHEIPPDEAEALKGIVEDKAPALKASKDKWESPEYPLIFKKPLPIPPQAEPRYIITNPVTGKDIWYYEMEIREFSQQVYPNLSPAKLVGYEGMSPGPTIIVPRGTESVVRFMNQAERENSVHLHGSPSRAPFDGWADDVTFPGQYKDYYYPNFQSARMLWYHDHAMGITAENAYFGQAGAYIVTDTEEDALGLPSGYGEYDIPLVLSSKFYNRDGTLQTTQGEDTSTWGDVIHVNGQPWPFLNVEPRKYRFRLLNTAISRNFALYIVTASQVNSKLPFQVIASDSGLLENPVTVSTLYSAPAERYEIVFDFSPYAGQAIEMRNLDKAGGIGVDDDYAETGKVMRFVVSEDPVPDPSTVPSHLRDIPFPPTPDVNTGITTIDHQFRFHRTNGEWRINGVGFADVANRVLARVPQGTVEIWELENQSGGWSHPIHVHLVDFRVLDRYPSSEASEDDPARQVMPYEAAGLKDVVWLGRHETVLVAAVYQPWDGEYMFHCHNLIHEDQDMMAAFNVTRLEDFGYDGTTDFRDPMDVRWRARGYDRGDWVARKAGFSEEAIRARVEEMARERPYSDVEEVEEALREYWEEHGEGNSDSAPAGKRKRAEWGLDEVTEADVKGLRFRRLRI